MLRNKLLAVAALMTAFGFGFGVAGAKDQSRIAVPKVEKRGLKPDPKLQKRVDRLVPEIEEAVSEPGKPPKPTKLEKVGINPKKLTAKRKWTAAELCLLIGKNAQIYDLPETFFARLIWTESRFDINALSPVGAQGVAQFMPGTAKERGLEDPFDPAQAIPKSAELLDEHRQNLGNLGLAAAAYNAGAGRVSRWLGGNSGLPFETENYVATITGNRAAYFKRANAVLRPPPLQTGKSFQDACKALPVMRTRFRGLVNAARTAWGVQVAGHFKRSKAMSNWLRVRPKLGLSVGNSQPQLYRARALRGLRGKWVVRLGANSRKEAIALCKRIRRAGGFCLVKRN